MKRDEVKQLHEKIDKLTDEVTVLKKQLAEKQDKLPTISVPAYTDVTTYTYIPSACRACPNHPSNGGSGVCNCTLGMMKVTC